MYLSRPSTGELFERTNARNIFCNHLLRIWFIVFLASKVNGDVNWSWGIVLLPVWFYIFKQYIFAVIQRQWGLSIIQSIVAGGVIGEVDTSDDPGECITSYSSLLLSITRHLHILVTRTLTNYWFILFTCSFSLLAHSLLAPLFPYLILSTHSLTLLFYRFFPSSIRCHHFFSLFPYFPLPPALAPSLPHPTRETRRGSGPPTPAPAET